MFIVQRSLNVIFSTNGGLIFLVCDSSGNEPCSRRLMRSRSSLAQATSSSVYFFWFVFASPYGVDGEDSDDEAARQKSSSNPVNYWNLIKETKCMPTVT